MIFLSHSLILFVSFVLYMAWEAAPGLHESTSFAIGACILLYLLLSFGKKTQAPAKGAFTKDAVSVFALSTLALLLLHATGGFDSPLFFLLYFMLFLVAFFLEPASAFTFSVLCVLLFFRIAAGHEELDAWLRLISVPALSPIAYYFGKLMQERMQRDAKSEMLQEKAGETAEKIVADVNAVASDKQSHLSDTQLTKLADIVKETEDLKKEAEKT